MYSMGVHDMINETVKCCVDPNGVKIALWRSYISLLQRCNIDGYGLAIEQGIYRVC